MRAQVEAERDEVVLARRLAEEFERVAAWLEPHFRRREAHEAASLYVKALLSRAERKNTWGLAEAAGKPAPYCFQHLLLRARWDEQAVRDAVLAYARERLGEGGVLVVDETGFLKKGEKSAGVARQYSGTAGRIENCQVGVFLAYETPRGHALIDRELYLPEEWMQSRPRRQQAGVPDAVTFRTKTQLAHAMLLRAFDAGLRPSWVTGDEVYGRDGELRRFLEQRHQRYVLAVAANTYVWRGFMQVKAGRVVSELKSEDSWTRLSAGAGSKGPRLYDWALVRVNSHTGTLARWLLFRRSLADPTDVAHYVDGLQEARIPGHRSPRVP
ncbi:IS701 family transposase [Pyxidicoccus xibeiensis]|uniref:IS701 family transposase n=1 Tax=Pyxidicoccus xibeiensis TaxID=2906759 RepID=UPI0020A72129|nr:IS701 family transposase [Pyxidicoccus xibeiensis]MCP3140842.1 IS701 family transposase [Pyxidicoccus xibeiensis]